ncbi:bifunctional phosphoglucose/phosphomannose isomerase [soil metagenome]
MSLEQILDDPQAMARSDPGDMLGAVADFPDQVADGWRRSRDLVLPGERPTAVAVVGMGGSAIGGDLVRGIWADRLTVPLEVVRGYDLPAWVGRDTLVVASSYSGATEETVSAFGQALERRCPVAVITTGGPLGDVARRAGLPVVICPGGGSPRSSVGRSLAVLAGILERAGLLEVGDAEMETAAAAARAMVARCQPLIPTGENPAKQLAWSALDRLVVIAASGPLAPVARRWKAQINENSKAAAVFEELPEASHNTVVGYEQPDSLRDHMLVVILTAASEHPRNGLRARLLAELLATARIGHQMVRVEGEERLAQALSAAVLGDYVSVYLAFTYGIDPSPVAVIDHMKERLGASPSDGQP